MDSKLAHCIHQLKGKTFPPSLVKEFEAYLPDSFEVLLEGVGKSTFDELQKCNALIVIFDLVKVKCSDKRQMYFDLLIESAHGDSERLRSEASQLLVRMTLFAEKCKSNSNLNVSNREEISEIITEALRLGVSSDAEAYIRDFMQRKF